MTKTTCLVEGCKEETDNLFCREHWSKVPKQHALAIRATRHQWHRHRLPTSAPARAAQKNHEDAIVEAVKAIERGAPSPRDTPEAMRARAEPDHPDQISKDSK